MQDVADAAKVHRGTVSRALRNDPQIPPRTRQRVQAIAQKLGYRPNALVSALMSHRRAVTTAAFQSVIAFVTQSARPGIWAKQAPSFRLLHEAVVDRAARHGYRVEEFCLGQAGARPGAFSRVLIQRGIHGMVVAPLRVTSGSLDLDCEPFSCVTIGHSVVTPDIARVATNHFQGMLIAVQKCHAYGYRRIGLVLAEGVNERVGHRWHGAYLAETAGEESPPPLLMEGFDAPRFAAWFTTHRPDVIIAVKPKPLLDVLKDLRIRTPRDVGLVLLELHEPGEAAGIDQHFSKVGAAGIDLLVGMLHRGDRGKTSEQQLLITPSWIDGPTLPAKK